MKQEPDASRTYRTYGAGHRSFGVALVISCAIHLLLLSLVPGYPTVQHYPGPILWVELPAQLEIPDQSSSVLERTVDLSHRQLEQNLQAPYFRLSERVELTPVPVPKDTPQLPHSPAYLPVEALTQKPELLNPDWLDEAWGLPSQASGEVTIKLLIDADGNVAQVVLEEGTSSELADWLRREIPKNVHFTPGRQGGIAVPSALRVRLKLGAIVGR